MLVGLRRGPKAPLATDPIEWLRDCHGRIRQFSDLAVRLAETDDASGEEVRDAAERLVRYFTISLPLHSEDEERSLAPRLLAKSLPGELERAVREMEREHGPIHRLVDELVPLWRALEGEPRSLETLRPKLLPMARDLRALFGPHLSAEERLVFVAARERLDAAEVAEIAREMRARRQGA